MRLKTIEIKKTSLRLTPKQRSIIVGLILGDGHLETMNQGRTYRLKIEHSIKQKEYVDWLYSQFSNLTEQKPKIKKRAENKDSYWFTTYSLGLFRFYAHQFYDGKKKIIPRIIDKLLDPLALAIWFMDDGSWKSNCYKTYIIHSVGYTRRDLELVKESLKKKFGIDISLHRQRKDTLRIYILTKSGNKFREIISPYIIPSLKYKLGNITPKK